VVLSSMEARTRQSCARNLAGRWQPTDCSFETFQGTRIGAGRTLA
jgi:hypothetical protein